MAEETLQEAKELFTKLTLGLETTPEEWERIQVRSNYKNVFRMDLNFIVYLSFLLSFVESVYRGEGPCEG
jgi:hypothetical protein